MDTQWSLITLRISVIYLQRESLSYRKPVGKLQGKVDNPMGFLDHRRKPSQIKQGEKVSHLFNLPYAQSNTPLIGWRTWFLKVCHIANGVKSKEYKDAFEEIIDTKQEFRLKSIAVDIIWDGPLMTTSQNPDGSLKKVSPSNQAKIDDSGRGDFGVYSYKNVDDLVRLCGYAQVVGLVESSGQVIEHDYGYRAQKCMIKKLWLLNGVAKNSQQIFYFSASDLEHVRKSLSKIYHCNVNTILDADYFYSFKWAKESV